MNYLYNNKYIDYNNRTNLMVLFFYVAACIIYMGKFKAGNLNTHTKLTFFFSLFKNIANITLQNVVSLLYFLIFITSSKKGLKELSLYSYD